MTSAPHSVRTQLRSLHVPLMNALIAQSITCCRKNCPSAQTLAMHDERQVMPIPGMPPPPKSKQPNAQVRPAEQFRSGHVPQSAGQLEQDS